MSAHLNKEEESRGESTVVSQVRGDGNPRWFQGLANNRRDLLLPHRPVGIAGGPEPDHVSEVQPHMADVTLTNIGMHTTVRFAARRR